MKPIKAAGGRAARPRRRSAGAHGPPWPGALELGVIRLGVLALACSGTAARAAGAQGAVPASPPAAAAAPAPGLLDRLGVEVARFLAYPHFERGYRLAREQRPAQAAVQFELGLARDPLAHEARLALADLQHQLGHHDQALRTLQTLAGVQAFELQVLQRQLAWHRADRPIDNARLDAAVAHPGLGSNERTFARRLRLERAVAAADWPRARADLEPLLATAATPQDWLQAVAVFSALGQHQAMRQALAHAALAASTPEERVALARARLQAARHAGDAAAQRQALADWQQLAPDDLELQRARRDEALARGAPAEGLAWARRAARGGGQWHDWRMLGHLLLQRGGAGAAAAAAQAFAQALAAGAPGDLHAPLWREVGHAEQAAGQPLRAAAAFERAADLGHSMAAWRLAAQAHAAAGQPAQALRLLAAQPAAQRLATDAQLMAAWAAQAGDTAAAAEHAELAARRLRDTTQRLAAWRDVAHRRAALGDGPAARRALQEVVALAPHDDTARLALADACLGQRDTACALAQLEAVVARGAPEPRALRRWVDARWAAGDAAGTAAAWQALARQPGLPPGEAVAAQAQSAELLHGQGQFAAAAAAYREALVLHAAAATSRTERAPGAPSVAQLHDGLAQALLAQDQPAPALQALRRAQAAAPTAARAAQLLRTFAALGSDTAVAARSKPASESESESEGEGSRLAGAATRATEHVTNRATDRATQRDIEADLERDIERNEQLVLAQLSQLPAAQHAEMLQLAATRRAAAARWREAEELWQALYRLQPGRDAALQLAQTQLALGQATAAGQTLEPWLRADLAGGPAHAAHAAARAKSNPASSAKTPATAGGEPPAASSEGTARLAGNAGARRQHALIVAQAAYAHEALGHHRQAAQQFELALAAEPAAWRWRSARAQSLARLGRADDAAEELETAIDQLLAEAPQAASDLWLLREQHRLLHRRAWSFAVYDGLRSAGARGAATSSASSGTVPSQGGAQALWQPGGWEWGPEQPVQLAARLYWSHRGSSLAIDGQSLQAGLGLRAKPLANWPLFAEVQRLQGLGSAAGDDWQVRASAGGSLGAPATGQQAAGPYGTLYADVARYLRAKRSAAYAEGRAGYRFALGERWVLSPHVLLAGRGERPDPSASAYSEWGLGMSLRHAFADTRYETATHSAEVLVQHRRGLEGVGNGWALTVVVGF